MRDSHCLKGIRRPFFNFFWRQVKIGWTKGDIFLNGLVKQLGISILENHSNTFSDDVCVLWRDGQFIHCDIARRDGKESKNGGQQRGFASAVCSEDGVSAVF